MRRFGIVAAIVLVSFSLCLLIALLIDGPIEISELSLQTVTNVITIASSIILLSTAIVLYQRFSGSQAIVDKQTEKIIELLNFISTLNFSIEIMGEDKGSYFNIHLTDYRQWQEGLGEKEKLAFQAYKNTYNYQLFGMFEKIDDFSRDPYIPKNIADQVKIDLNFSRGGVLVPPKDKLFIVYVRGNFKDSKPLVITEEGESIEDSVSLYEELNGDPFVFEELIGSLERVYRVAFEWLDKNNPTVCDSLNITRIEGMINKVER